jgi:hypothetical protein
LVRQVVVVAADVLSHMSIQLFWVHWVWVVSEGWEGDSRWASVCLECRVLLWVDVHLGFGEVVFEVEVFLFVVVKWIIKIIVECLLIIKILVDAVEIKQGLVGVIHLMIGLHCSVVVVYLILLN